MQKKKVIIRISVTLSLAVLAYYAGMTVFGHHHVSPFLLIAPVTGVLAGMNYLRRSRI